MTVPAIVRAALRSFKVPRYTVVLFEPLTGHASIEARCQGWFDAVHLCKGQVDEATQTEGFIYDHQDGTFRARARFTSSVVFERI